MPKEAKARILINELFKRSGWRFFDDENGPANIALEANVKLVEEAEVEEVLSKPGEDRPGREGSRAAIGRTSGGRYLRVIYVPDSEPNSVFVITAYELRGKPLIAYRRRRRRKKK